MKLVEKVFAQGDSHANHFSRLLAKGAADPTTVDSYAKSNTGYPVAFTEPEKTAKMVGPTAVSYEG